jgi:methionine-rich copper-binding protein CopC
VTLTGNPNFETKASYSFNVVATDAASNASSQAVTLAINDIADETPPTVTSVTVPTNATYKIGDTLSFTINTSENVTVTNTPRIALTVGSSTVYANYASGSGSSALVFSYLVQSGDLDSNGIAVGSLGLNSGTLSDAAGNAMDLTLNSVGSTVSINVDGLAPTVSSIAISSATGVQNSTLNAGDVVSVTVTMNDATNVTGTPQLALNIGGTTVQANYVSGTGTTALVFQYTILATQTDADGISVAADSLSLNAGTLKDAAGNNATLTHVLFADNASYKVDTAAPTANFTAATDNVGSVTGALNSGDTTDDTALVLSGSCEAGSTVNVYNGTTLLGAATISGTTWSYSATVADGSTYQFNVRETDLAGNTSAATSNFTVIGDTSVTANFTAATDNVGTVTGALSSGQTTDGTALVLSASCEAGSTVNVYNGTTLLGAATISGTTWSYSATVADGSTYQFNVKETDLAGNTSAATSNFTVIGDTSVTANFTSATDDVGSLTGTLINGARTDDTSLALTGTCEAGSTVNVYNGAILLGAATVSGTTWSYTATLVNGATYQFNEKETDAAGNTSVATSNFTVTGDTSVTARLTSVTDNMGSITGALVSGSRSDDSSLVFAGTCEAGSVVYIYDGASLIGAGTVSGTNWTYTASIADSTSYLFNVSETDTAGNHSVHTSNFAVTGDTSAPTLSSSTPADNATAVAVNSNIVLTFNENVLAGSGNVVISNGGADVRTISITDSSQVSISGSVVTINPTADLAGGTHYDVTMSAGVITDTAGNNFSGIAENARDFDAAAALNSSIVVFDLVQGVTSAHSSRTFSAGVDYTIYIRVNSGSTPLSHSDAHGDTWGRWTGANNLDANDKVILVGSGSNIKFGSSGQTVKARSQGLGPGTIQWGDGPGWGSWAANLTNTGLFRRYFNNNPVVGATVSNGIYLWQANAVANNGPWSNVNGFPGKATGALWMNGLPANVLTSQGLAS